MGGPGTAFANTYWRDVMKRAGHSEEEIAQIEREIEAETNWYDLLLFLFCVGFVAGFLISNLLG